MAHSSRLTEWLLANAERLNLRVTQFDWVRKWGLEGYHDFELSVEIAGRKFIGRGTARGEELAFLKAGAEAIERAYCAGHGIHSTGVAAHTDAALAAESARNELIERDAFFCHFYSGTPFITSRQHFKEMEHSFGQVFREFSRRGVEYNLHQARSAGQPVFAFTASGLSASPPFGGIIGLGSDESNWRSIQSAFLECARNVAAVLRPDGGTPTYSEAEFCAIKNPTAMDRQRLARNTAYWKTVQHLFPAAAEDDLSLMKEKSKQRIPITEEKLACPFIELMDAPVVVYRASLHGQYGDRLERTVPTTLRRIYEFTGQKINAVESKPHFLG